MENRRYSIKEIQKMIQLSPSVLQSLLKKYRNHLNIIVEEGPDGDEIFIDQPSYERLLFIKQLEFNMNLTQEEVTNQLVTTSTHELRNLVCKDPIESLKKAMDSLSDEVNEMSESLQQILSSYVTLIQEVNFFRAENRILRKELDAIKIKQNMIIEQIKRDHVFEEQNELIRKETVN